MADDKDKLKSRLKDLKEQLKSDDVQLNTDELYASNDEFPNNHSDEKYIDYVEEGEQHNLFATQVIENIVRTYVKNEKLLDSNRLKDLKQQDILDYANILLLISLAKSNLIKLQESIDSGDMSKEAFDSVNKAAKELRDNMKMKSELLTSCEKYWSNYSEKYGFENEEEKIASESKDTTNEKSTKIVDTNDLIETIRQQQDEMIENTKNNKQKDKNI